MTRTDAAGFSSSNSPTQIAGQVAIESLCLLLVFSLALLTLGPMLDHHFAERHPEHHHVYLGAATPDHSHSFERTHSHDRNRMLWTKQQPPGDLPENGVLVVASNDGTFPSVADLTFPTSLLPAGLIEGGGSGMPRLSFDAAEVLTSVNVSPPRRPPRI